jgi:hypothetical protein
LTIVKGLIFTRVASLRRFLQGLKAALLPDFFVFSVESSEQLGTRKVQNTDGWEVASHEP